MPYQFIRTDEELKTFLDGIRSAKWIAFDTEFLSEGKYRLELCLIQVAVEDHIVLIDPLDIKDMTPFWERICDPETEVIVHSGRTEMEFCYKGVGRLPRNLFDVQLAGGFVGCDYPAGFKVLGEKILNLEFSKGETRTNWHNRPLSLLQIEYAINDVCYLKQMTDRIRERLEELGRMAWFLEERDAFRDTLLKSFTREAWQTLPAMRGFSPVQLAIVRDIWRWRKAESLQANVSQGKILRDDLIVELARRMSDDPKRILAVHGLERHRKYVTEISDVIQKALALEEDDLPEPPVFSGYPQYLVATQFLTTVLSDFANENQIALSLLAPLHDVRDYVARFYGTLPEKLTTRMSQGWRAELLGTLPADLLQGKLAIKLAPYRSSRPIELISLPDDF